MTTADLQARILRRIGEDGSTDALLLAHVLRLASWAQRLFALATLCIETTNAFDLSPGVSFYHMRDQFDDWIIPLRVRLSSGSSGTFTDGTGTLWNIPEFSKAEFNADGSPVTSVPGQTLALGPKLRPATLGQLTALHAAWPGDVGLPDRYGVVKSDLLFINRAPAEAGIQLTITYARTPQRLTDTSVGLEIPEPDQPALIDCAAYLWRLAEGGQELVKSKALFQRFMKTAGERAAHVRARSRAQQYDNAPPELVLADKSRTARKEA